MTLFSSLWCEFRKLWLRLSRMSKQGGWCVKVNWYQHKLGWWLFVHWHMCCGCYWEEECRLLTTSLQLQSHSYLWQNLSGENSGCMSFLWFQVWSLQGCDSVSPILRASGQPVMCTGLILAFFRWTNSVSYQNSSVMGLDGPFIFCIYIL